jgi:transcriptional regulator with XRE-family HTH domain
MTRTPIRWSHDYDVEVGRRIRARRLQLGGLQHWLARKADVPLQQLQAYERGAVRAPVQVLERLARVLSVTVDDLLPTTKG